MGIRISERCLQSHVQCGTVHSGQDTESTCVNRWIDQENVRTENAICFDLKREGRSHPRHLQRWTLRTFCLLQCANHKQTNTVWFLLREAPRVPGATEAAVEWREPGRGREERGCCSVGVSVRDALRSAVQRCPQSEQHREVNTYSYVRRVEPMLSVLTAKKIKQKKTLEVVMISIYNQRCSRRNLFWFGLFLPVHTAGGSLSLQMAPWGKAGRRVEEGASWGLCHALGAMWAQIPAQAQLWVPYAGDPHLPGYRVDRTFLSRRELFIEFSELVKREKNLS